MANATASFRMVTIPRAELRAAVEAGIENAPTLAYSERAKLRNVAETATQVAAGTSMVNGWCACPAVKAGLTHSNGGLLPRARAFAAGYDADVVSIHPLAASIPLLLTVKD